MGFDFDELVIVGNFAIGKFVEDEAEEEGAVLVIPFSIDLVGPAVE